MIIRKCCIAILALLLSCNLAAQDGNADEVWFKTVRKLVNLTERVEALEAETSSEVAVEDTHIGEVTTQMAALKAEIASLTLQIKDQTTEVAAINTERSGEVSARCPAGQLLIGLTVVDTDKGRSCSSCISGVKLLCQPVALVRETVTDMRAEAATTITNTESTAEPEPEAGSEPEPQPALKATPIL